MNDFPRCATCRHWKAPPVYPNAVDYAGGVGVFGLCQAVRYVGEFGNDMVEECDTIASRNWLSESERARLLSVRDDPRHAAVVEDAEGYKANLRCRADFGCVLHEATP